MADLRERIKLLLAHFGLNQTEFAEHIGISKGMMSHVMSLSGRHSTFSDDKINRILEVFPTVNRDWLVNGDGDMLSTSSEASNVPFQSSFDFSETSQTSTEGYRKDNGGISEESLTSNLQEPEPSKEPVSAPSSVVNEDADRVNPTRERSTRQRQPKPVVSTPATSQAESRKTVSRIVIFYTDGTFCEYHPDHTNY